MKELVILGVFSLVGIVWVMLGAGTRSRYPDGKCYFCRAATALPGEDCPKCGTTQP